MKWGGVGPVLLCIDLCARVFMHPRHLYIAFHHLNPLLVSGERVKVLYIYIYIYIYNIYIYIYIYIYNCIYIYI